ncbi:MAG TPA: CdaR family protein [Balneolaceae bacterium]|nr:CdaR family protein [Balneolaceae bacterium]
MTNRMGIKFLTVYALIMESSKTEQFKEKVADVWHNITTQTDDDIAGDMGRERLVVFIISLILALCLWLMVNLSLGYNLNIRLPISLGAVPEDRALAENLPETATVSVMGEGWKLLNIYNNPPTINVDVNDEQVNLYSQVQRQMSASGIEVQKVQPLILTLKLEERITKKVPVRPNIKVSFEDQYGFTGAPNIKPDSITISGAVSLVQNIESWPTDSVHFTDVSQDLSQVVELETGNELISLSQNQVIFNADVAQFTEGETEVKVTGKGFPEGSEVTFSPPSITIKFNVPIEEYPQVEDLKIFNAYVTYEQVLEDSVGFVTPHIEQIIPQKYNVKISSFKPRRISYFKVLD